MKLLLCLGVAVGLIALASALNCKSCDFRALSICFTTSSTATCSGNCSVTKASIGSMPLFRKQGCATTCTSNSTKDGVFSFDYTISCCDTDLCNAGNSLKVSLSLGLGLALLWLLKAL
ncbi:ly-6/neurotoxin-like protein 1 [Hyperolius riggenbachi]|uniref:ly-6/neurotoxin-like protein 1 n=1 Tax=Hyperolius riggenbachi TaxID=752182 RepID=UPI0035A389B5